MLFNSDHYIHSTRKMERATHTQREKEREVIKKRRKQRKMGEMKNGLTFYTKFDFTGKNNGISKRYTRTLVR